VRDPRGLYSLAYLMISLPRIRLSLTDEPPGRAIREYLEPRTRGIPYARVAQSVLTLPTTTSAYLSGRHRQALRTNLRRASEDGIYCTAIEGEPRDHLEPWLSRPFPGNEASVELEEWLRLPHHSAKRWLAFSADGVLMALAVVTIDAEVACMNVLKTSSYRARWMLHQHVVASLIEARVRHLIAQGGDALTLDPGTQYFLRLLGYRIAHLLI